MMEKVNTVNLKDKYISREALMAWIWATITDLEPIKNEKDAGKIAVLHALEEFVREFDPIDV